MGYGRVILDDGDYVGLEGGIMICKLVCKSGKDVLEFLAVKVVSRTEKAGTKESLLSSRCAATVF